MNDLENGDEPTGPLELCVSRTRTNLESAEIEIELADHEHAAQFLERVAAMIRDGKRSLMIRIKTP